MNCENESERGREEKPGAAEETNTSWTQILSFGTSCQDCDALSPLLKLRSEYGAKWSRMGGRAPKHDPPLSSHWELGGNPSGLIPCVLLAGRAGLGGGGVRARHSVVICMVLRCNCSISNNVVRLLVQTNRRRRSRSRGADRTSQLL